MGLEGRATEETTSTPKQRELWSICVAGYIADISRLVHCLHKFSLRAASEIFEARADSTKSASPLAGQ